MLSVTIVFNTIGVVWFFQAHEDFTFILIRSLVVKIVAAILLFTLVKSDNDLIIYAGIIVFADAGNNILNFFRLGHYINYHDIKWNQLRIFRHLKPSIVIFTLSFIVSLYVDMPTLFLGFMCGDTSVGYYTTATKLIKIVLTMVTALGTTLLPRMSNYYATGDIDKFKKLEHSGLTFVIGASLPISMALVVIAPDVITCFAGSEFTSSIYVLQIVAPSMVFIAIASIAGYQSLYPQGHERIIICGALIALVLSVIFNITLVPVFQQVGAAVAYLVAEVTVTIAILIIGARYISYRFINGSTVKFVIACIIMLGVLYALHRYVDMRIVVKLIIEVVTGVVTYITVLLLLRESMLCGLVQQFFYKFACPQKQ